MRMLTTLPIAASCASVLSLALVVPVAGDVVHTNRSDDSARAFMSESARYSCQSPNSVIDQLVEGPRRQVIAISGRFPRRIDAGDAVSVKGLRVKSTLNARMTHKYKVDWKLKRVRILRKGIVSDDTKVWLNLRSRGEPYRSRVDIRNGRWRTPRLHHKLMMPTRGDGRIKASVKNAKQIGVYLPKKLVLAERWSPPLTGSTKGASFRCKILRKVSARERLLGRIKVG